MTLVTVGDRVADLRGSRRGLRRRVILGPMTEPASPPEAYPAHWEADVVLRDGSVAHLRPIRPEDADRVRALPRRTVRRVDLPALLRPAHAADATGTWRGSPTSTTTTGSRWSRRWTTTSSASAATTASTRTTAEVAFNISDAHQGRGVGSVLLEHLAAVARERGRAPVRGRRPAAEPQDDRGLQRGRLRGEPPLRRRRHRRLVRHHPDRAVAGRVRGPRAPRRVGQRARGPAFPRRWRWSAPAGGRTRSGTGCCRTSSPAASPGRSTPSTPRPRRSRACRPTPRSLTSGRNVDLAVIAVPAESVLDVVRDCAGAGVRALVVVIGRLRRDRPRGGGAPARAAAHRPQQRHARDRAQLLRHRQHRPGGAAERLPRARAAAGRPVRPVLPVRGPRHRRPGLGRPPRPRRLDLRLRRQPGRRLRQRLHAVLARRRRHHRGRSLPGDDGQPAQVLPHRPSPVPHQAGHRREVRGVVVRRAAGAPRARHAGAARPRSTRCCARPG